ncbi:GTP-dependent dephospho-CoA kinase family protein [Halopenitus salinus]|uniref:GTP-dependent dephospho-CoA kinase n=1 Tax=Halopenitus salinus TaxID=1198295 RepID=A0ABD5URD5_9EURY
MLRLPRELRDAFKEPLGPVTTDADDLLERIAETRAIYADGKRGAAAPLVAVGDVVTYHLMNAGRNPDVALVDGRTEREAVDAEIARALAASDDRRIAVENPPGELSRELLAALMEAIEDPDPTVIEVDGEEDLAALPALAAAPLGSSVVYGQPGEGMVHAPVTETTQRDARELLGQFEGDVERAFEILGVDSGSSENE